jgi:hypothetical protein
METILDALGNATGGQATDRLRLLEFFHLPFTQVAKFGVPEFPRGVGIFQGPGRTDHTSGVGDVLGVVGEIVQTPKPVGTAFPEYVHNHFVRFGFEHTVVVGGEFCRKPLVLELGDGEERAREIGDVVNIGKSHGPISIQ